MPRRSASWRSRASSSSGSLTVVRCMYASIPGWLPVRPDAVVAGAVAAMLQVGSLIRDLDGRELVTMVASLYPAALPVDEVMELTGIAGFARRHPGGPVCGGAAAPPTGQDGFMDLAFVAFGAWSLAATAEALRPLGRAHPWLSGLSWLISWLTIELAGPVLALQLAVTGLFLLAGVLLWPLGWLGLALEAASWAGLAVVIGRSVRTRGEIDRAFAGLDLPRPRRRRLAVTRVRDVTYATVGRTALRLDVHRPRDPAPPGARRPAILQVHGGAWVWGDKRTQGIPLLRHLASQGWVGFNANYRLSPRATFPDHLVDLKRAVAYIRDHADEHGVDPDFIVVTGGSAGGHLATLLALTAGEEALQPGFEGADTSVQAAVPFYGVYDLGPERGYFPAKTVRRFFGRVIIKASPTRHPERFRAASAFAHLRPDAPPFLVVHGALDTLAPVAMARDLVAELREVSTSPVLYLELAGAQHAFDVLPTGRTRLVVRAVDRYLTSLWEAHRRRRAAAGGDPGAEAGDPPGAA